MLRTVVPDILINWAAVKLVLLVISNVSKSPIISPIRVVGAVPSSLYLQANVPAGAFVAVIVHDVAVAGIVSLSADPATESC
jgi:hypothetical protein